MTNNEMMKTHLESSRSLLRWNECVGVENLAVRSIPHVECKSKIKRKNIGITGQSEVKHRYFRKPCFSSKEEKKNKSTCFFFHFCRPNNGITIKK